MQPLSPDEGTGPQADRQRQVMQGLNYSQFRAADNSYLDPIREMLVMASGETSWP